MTEDEATLKGWVDAMPEQGLSGLEHNLEYCIANFEREAKLVEGHNQGFWAQAYNIVEEELIKRGYYD